MPPHPHQGHRPWTQKRKLLGLSEKQFPAETRKPADASEKRLPCVKGAGPQGLRDCRLPSKKHAEPPWQKKIAALRVGCATGVRTRARRQHAANRMQSIRGKQKKALAEIYFRPRLFLFSLGPWFCFFSFLPTNMRKQLLLITFVSSRSGCRGDTPAVGYRGCVSPCLGLLLHPVFCHRLAGGGKGAPVLPNALFCLQFHHNLATVFI